MKKTTLVDVKDPQNLADFDDMITAMLMKIEELEKRIVLLESA